MNCSQLYLGIDRQVPECDGDLFSVELSPSASPEAVAIRKVLGSKYIYYLAPHTGCGCGWDFLDVGTPSDENSKASCELLRKFLGSIERLGQPCKIYSVSSESIGTSPESETRHSASEFMDNISDYRVKYSSDVARVFLVGT
jgi:hypothetical protein